MPSSLTHVLTPSGWKLLASVEKLAGSHTLDTLHFSHALRSEGFDADTVTAVLNQIGLRREAEAKFGALAHSLIFTRDGLEQATRLPLAAQHADRFRTCGATHVADLGCGIGTDSLAIAGLDLQVLAVDLNEDAASAAAANLRAFPEAAVIQGDVTTLTPKDLRERGVDAIFADPARRTGAGKGNRRLGDPESWSPPLSAIVALREDFDRIGIKVAPGIEHSLIPSDFHAQWASIDGDLLEAALWSPGLAPEGRGRSALILRKTKRNDTNTETFTRHVLHAHTAADANAATRQAPVGKLGHYLAEPDPAVIRAGLIADLAEKLDAHLISSSIAYLSADDIAPSPFISRFEIEEVVPMRAKSINKALKQRKVGRVEIKKRGTDVTPEQLRAQLSLDGEDEATVILTRIGTQHKAIIARRCSSANT